MQKIKFYRVQDFNGTHPFIINSELTLQQLYFQIKQKVGHKNFVIYYHFSPYLQEQHGNKKLKQIVSHNPMVNPTFLIYDIISDNEKCPYVQKYGQGLAAAQKYEQPPKQYSIGQNGLIVFDNRNTSLLASSINHATSQEEYIADKKQIMNNFNTSIVKKDRSRSDQPQEGLMKRIFTKLGILKANPSPKNIQNTIDTLKKVETKQDMLSHIDRQYSDYDPKFAAYLQAIYLKYAIMSSYKLHYIEYKNMQQGIIKHKFASDAKVAIIGDFGTGLNDSFELLRHIIINKQADIVIHLGDVYYAGTPNQFRNNIMEPLNKLRKEAASKFNKNVLFYAIPGNHDYYTWGLPYLCFIANANQVRQVTGSILKSDTLMQQHDEQNSTKQQASYFCLQSHDSKWQFIGLDTAYHDSNPVSQLNSMSLGPRLREKEVDWFVDKMEHFPGSTILLTHHQLFSIHDRICGAMSKYQAFTCVNPLLSAQLFKYLPSISCWFWGHEHSIMFFDDDVLGVKKCRLLGNSSFHVFQKQAPYLRKKGFPHIPLIQSDQKYIHKYLPLNPEPDEKNPDCYFNLSYALIDFGKQKNNSQMFSSTLTVQYYCCPCYAQADAKKRHFQPYLMHQQQIQPRANVNLINTDTQLKKGYQVVGNVCQIDEGTQLMLKAQIGLFADKGTRLSLSGIKYRLIIQKSVNNQFSKMLAQIKTQKQQKQKVKDEKQNQIKDEKSGQSEQRKPQGNQQQQQIQMTLNIRGKQQKRILLDGDIIAFKQVRQLKKITHANSNQFKEPTSPVKADNHDTNQNDIQIKDQTDLLSSLPQLKPLSSLHSSEESLPRESQQIVNQTINQLVLHDILQDKFLQIKKHRVLKDSTIPIKFGDAFSLRDVDKNEYLSCQIGMYGGVLKLAKLKPNQQPCLFMFIPDSKITQSKK